MSARHVDNFLVYSRVAQHLLQGVLEARGAVTADGLRDNVLEERALLFVGILDQVVVKVVTSEARAAKDDTTDAAVDES